MSVELFEFMIHSEDRHEKLVIFSPFLANENITFSWQIKRCTNVR